MAKNRLLGPDLRLRLNAVLAPTSPGGYLETLVTGYRRAATYLNKATLAQDSGLFADEVAYPILYLWRHYLEVRLKSVIALLENSPKATHDLKGAWQAAKSRLEGEGFVGTWIEEIESVVLEFDEADRSSQAFRYTTDPKGQALIAPDTVANLNRLLSGMQRIADQLDGLVDEIIERRKM